MSWFFQLKSSLQVISVSYLQVYPSFPGILCFTESLLTRCSVVRLVVIHWCGSPGSSYFQMENLATKLPTPSGLFQLFVPTKITFLASDHLSPLFGKLPVSLLASLVEHFSVLYLILIPSALMVAFMLTVASFGLSDRYLFHLILIKLSSSSFLSLENNLALISI